MNNLTEFQQRAAGTALEKLLTGDHFDITAREGDRVRWVPTEAAGDADSAYCSDGTISRFDGQRAMVKFDAAVIVDGFDGAREVAIDPQTLRVL